MTGKPDFARLERLGTRLHVLLLYDADFPFYLHCGLGKECPARDHVEDQPSHARTKP